ncbi:MAG: hypothetical protein AAB558_02090 [Patescibacteria group bacterium]
MIEVHYVCSGSCGTILDEEMGVAVKVCSKAGCTMQTHPLVKKYFCTRHQAHLTPDELAEHQAEQD